MKHGAPQHSGFKPLINKAFYKSPWSGQTALQGTIYKSYMLTSYPPETNLGLHSAIHTEKWISPTIPYKTIVMLKGISLFCGKHISVLIRDYTRLILYTEKVYLGIHETPASKRRSKCGFLLKVSEI